MSVEDQIEDILEDVESLKTRLSNLLSERDKDLKYVPKPENDPEAWLGDSIITAAVRGHIWVQDDERFYFSGLYYGWESPGGYIWIDGKKHSFSTIKVLSTNTHDRYAQLETRLSWEGPWVMKYDCIETVEVCGQIYSLMGEGMCDQRVVDDHIRALRVDERGFVLNPHKNIRA